MSSLVLLVCFLSLGSIFATNIEKKESEHIHTRKETTDSEPSSSTTESALRPCPPDKSLHTREDIKFMIDYRVKTLSIYDYINNSYYAKAVAVRDKQLKDFKQFRDWYQNRPEHLKHNVKNIAFVRGHIEPFVKRTAQALNQYPELQRQYDEQLNRTNTLFRKLNRYKIICENNCETKASFRISRRSNFNGYYCSSLKDLDQRIKSRLTEFAQKLSSTMLNRVSNDDREFSRRNGELKNKLEDVALKEFGKTMHDILHLQDQYHHFVQDLLHVDANVEVYNIKEMRIRIDSKLLELEHRVENYGMYCRTCNEIALRSFSKKMSRHVTFNKNESKSKDLVDHLLNLKYAEIQNSTNNDYSNIFKELNSSINNMDSKEIYLTDLKPIQDEIIEMIKTEKTDFNKLKSIASPTTVTKLTKLSSDTKHLLSKIYKEINDLNQIWPK